MWPGMVAAWLGGVDEGAGRGRGGGEAAVGPDKPPTCGPTPGSVATIHGRELSLTEFCGKAIPEKVRAVG